MTGEFGNKASFIEDIARGEDDRARQDRLLTHAAITSANQERLNQLVDPNEPTPWERRLAEATSDQQTAQEAEAPRSLYKDLTISDGNQPPFQSRAIGGLPDRRRY